MKAKSILIASILTLGAILAPTLPASAHDRGHYNGHNYRKYYGNAPVYQQVPYRKVYYRDNGYYYTRPYGYYNNRYYRPNGVQLNISLGN